MARPRTGELVVNRTSRGKTFAVRFPYRGERYLVWLGAEWEGWTEDKAIAEQRYLMAKVNRGEWTPPAPEREPAPTATDSFQIEASEWLHRQAVRAGDPERRSKTIRNLEWRLSLVMDVFAPIPLNHLSYRHAEDLVNELVQERLAIDRGREQGSPLTQKRIHPRTGRVYELRRRGVSNTSIRRGLDAAQRVLLLAAEGRPPVAHMTPHTLRRTFASILAVCDVPPRRAMYLMGHTDAKFTMSVYQQVLDMGPGSVEALETALGCSLSEARAVYVAHGVYPLNSHSETTKASGVDSDLTREA